MSTSTPASTRGADFASVYGLLPVPLLLVDTEAVIQDANAAAATLVGTHASALRTCKLPELVTEDAGKLRSYLSLCAGSSVYLPGSFTFRAAEGELLRLRCDGARAQGIQSDGAPAVLLRLAPRVDGNRGFFALNEKIAQLAHEVAERKHTEELLAAQNEVLEAIAWDAPLGAVLDRLVRAIEGYAGPEMLASVLLLDDDGVHLRHGAAPSLPDAYNRAIDGVAIGHGVGSCGTAAFTGKPVIVSDIAHDPLWEDYRELALSHGLRACWSTPICSGDGAVLGTFAMYYREPRLPGKGDQDLIRLVTRTASLAIERHKAQRRIRHVLSEQAAILDGLPARIALIDGSGHIRMVNKAWSAWLVEAGSPGLLEGSENRIDSIAGMLRSGDDVCGSLITAVRDVAGGSRECASLECSSLGAGEERRLHITVAPVPGRTAGLRDVVLMHVDVTEQRLAEEALARQATELMQMNSELQQFAYVASHDLREPLRTVKSFSQLFVRRFGESLGPESEQYLGYISEGVGRMESLLNDLLVYSRVAQGRTVEFGPVALDTAMRTALGNLHAMVEDSGADVIWGDLPIVHGHETQLVQLLQNLIANAIKYRSAARPVIRVTSSRSDTGWTVSVADNGKGIDPKYHQVIFGLFKRLDSREVPGTGIGLALCRRIVEAHGGNIWVESAPAAGATFHFTIPEKPR